MAFGTKAKELTRQLEELEIAKDKLRGVAKALNVSITFDEVERIESTLYQAIGKATVEGRR